MRLCPDRQKAIVYLGILYECGLYFRFYGIYFTCIFLVVDLGITVVLRSRNLIIKLVHFFFSFLHNAVHSKTIKVSIVTFHYSTLRFASLCFWNFEGDENELSKYTSKINTTTLCMHKTENCLKIWRHIWVKTFLYEWIRIYT